MHIVREYPADYLTPVTAYAAVARKGSCLLETAAGTDKPGRRSYIGIEPLATFTVHGDSLDLQIEGRTETFDGDPYAVLSALEKRFQVPAAGFISYDAVRHKENIPARHPDAFGLPDFLFQFYRSSILFDHEAQTVAISAGSEEEIERIAALLHSEARLAPLAVSNRPLDAFPDLSDEAFARIVEKAKEFLIKGDVFQIVPSRTFKAEVSAEPFQIYRALRQTSPAPYLFFFEFEGYAIAGASPEKLISVENGQVESTPIAGTCKAGGSIEKLLSDPKEMAEHVMLVDLARNDLGAVCLPGSIKVASYKEPIRFSHVTHIVSRIVGRLDPKLTALDAFKASFPAGTLTGAPKVRAMELIDELEMSRRGLYGGAIVRLDGKGNLQSCIAIRMAFIKDGAAYVRAGAGIVLDSDPMKEAEETRLKASTVLDALELAGGRR